MKIIHKLKIWREGKLIPPTTEDLFNPNKEPEGDKFKQSLIPKVLTFIGRFILAHWKWLIGTLIALAFLVFTILEYIKEQ